MNVLKIAGLTILLAPALIIAALCIATGVALVTIVLLPAVLALMLLHIAKRIFK